MSELSKPYKFRLKVKSIQIRHCKIIWSQDVNYYAFNSSNLIAQYICHFLKYTQRTNYTKNAMLVHLANSYCLMVREQSEQPFLICTPIRKISEFVLNCMQIFFSALADYLQGKPAGFITIENLVLNYRYLNQNNYLVSKNRA
ncbi:hypothetical protein Avbf_17907 [Armadillidium vulgare]|nr:hypothetical protein Avbf_17907 [Armadillidium vulgare]